MRNNITKGETLIGRITGIKPYGLFIKLPNGETALLHRSNCSNYHYILGDYYYNYDNCINNAVCCKIKDITSDGRISLEQGEWENLLSINIDRNINDINIPTYIDIHCNNVYIDNKNKYYTFKNGILYSKDEKTIIKIFSSLEYIKIDKQVENIVSGAIPRTVKSLDLSGSGIKNIKSWSFSNLDIITVSLPPKCIVTNNAFYKCTSLKTIIFNDDTIRHDAFDECNALEEIKNLNNCNYDFLSHIGCGSSVLGKKLQEQEHEILINKSKFSLDDINIINTKEKDVYVKWTNSDNNSTVESRIRKIVDDKISVETNGYIYYIYPYQIVEILDNTTSTPFPEDWFGGEVYLD